SVRAITIQDCNTVDSVKQCQGPLYARQPSELCPLHDRIALRHPQIRPNANDARADCDSISAFDIHNKIHTVQTRTSETTKQPLVVLEPTTVAQACDRVSLL